jgi:nucleoside-diphosphate-sugar epimerase
VRSAVLLGCGYTGERVARRLLASGVRVVATTRDPSRLAPLAAAAAGGLEVLAVDAAGEPGLRALAARARELEPGFAVLCSVPPVELGGRPADATARLLAALDGAGRVVQLSTTSVYGDRLEVDERTPVAPRTPADRLRLEGEAAAAAGPWSSMVLRPAAIYGPGRGVQATAGAVLRRALDPDRVVSRVHVDDLAALCEAALRARVTGAWPVADDEPATPREVARFCASIGIAVPELPPPGGGGAGGRRVDGRAVRSALGIALAYPTYREGYRALAA